MSVTTTRHIRKPLYVDAVRITSSNFDEIAAWCQGEIQQDEVPVGTGNGKKYIKIRVHNPKNPRQTKAFIGDWLLYTERGYKVYTNKAFHASFDDASTMDPPVTYPYTNGDIKVIGPECFSQKNGEVLCWRGVNYVPQQSPDDIAVGDEKLAEGVTVNDAVAAARQNGSSSDQVDDSFMEHKAGHAAEGPDTESIG